MALLFFLIFFVGSVVLAAIVIVAVIAPLAIPMIELLGEFCTKRGEAFAERIKERWKL